tara:strand:+ start:145 stop:369 length:225 start_codon:yes stop_codon:yes gene_type:complete
MTEDNKSRKLQEEPSNSRSIRVPDKIWKLVKKASKGSPSVNEYLLTIIENDLIKRKMIKKSDRKKRKIVKSHKE